MTVECPSCQGVFRVRTDRLPPQGARTRCGRCGTMIRVDAGGPPSPSPPAPIAQVPERITDGLFELPSPRAAVAGTTDLFALDQPGPRPVATLPPAMSPAVFAPDEAPEGGGRRPGVFGWLFRFLG